MFTLLQPSVFSTNVLKLTLKNIVIPLDRHFLQNMPVIMQKRVLADTIGGISITL